MGTLIIGKMESGVVVKGQNLVLMPNKVSLPWYRRVHIQLLLFSETWFHEFHMRFSCSKRYKWSRFGQMMLRRIEWFLETMWSSSWKVCWWIEHFLDGLDGSITSYYFVVELVTRLCRISYNNVTYSFFVSKAFPISLSFFSFRYRGKWNSVRVHHLLTRCALQSWPCFRCWGGNPFFFSSLGQLIILFLNFLLFAETKNISYRL